MLARYLPHTVLAVYLPHAVHVISMIFSCTHVNASHVNFVIRERLLAGMHASLELAIVLTFSWTLIPFYIQGQNTLKIRDGSRNS